MARTGLLTIAPKMISFPEWAAQTGWLLQSHGTVPKVVDPNNWRQWASVVTALPALRAVGATPPEPGQKWEDWAARFNQAAALLTA